MKSPFWKEIIFCEKIIKKKLIFLYIIYFLIDFSLVVLDKKKGTNGMESMKGTGSVNFVWRDQLIGIFDS